jgi:hypothetical protein
LRNLPFPISQCPQIDPIRKKIERNVKNVSIKKKEIVSFQNLPFSISQYPKSILQEKKNERNVRNISIKKKK